MADTPKPDTSLEQAYDPTVGALRLSITPQAPPVGSNGLAEGQKAYQAAGTHPLLPTDAETSARVATHAGRPLTVMPMEPVSESAPPDLPQTTKDAYAHAQATAATTGPQDFAERYAGALGQADPTTDTEGLTRLAKATSAALPSTEDAIDTGISVTQVSGKPLTPETAAATKDNLLRLWAATGMKFSEVAQEAVSSGLLADALTTPNSVVTPETPPTEGWSKEEIAAPAMSWLDPFKELLHSQLETTFGKLPGPEEMKDAEAQLKTEGVDYGPADIQKRAVQLLQEKLGPEATYERADRLAHVIVGGMAGPVPAGSLGAGPAILAKTKALAAATDTIKPVIAGLEHDLNLLQAAAEADKAAILTQLPKALDPAWMNRAFQEKVAKEVEQRLVSGQAALSPEVRAFLNSIKKLTGEENSLAKAVAALEGRDTAGLRSVEQGYMHRVVVGHEAPGSFNDALLERGDVVKAGKQRTLSKFASSLQARQDFYVMQRGDIRIWGERKLEDLGAKLGSSFTDPKTGVRWQVKPATMEEIEAHTDIEYHKNYLANLLDNVMRLRRVKRNIEFLQAHKAELAEKELFLPRGTKDIPDGWRKVDLPQLDGYAQPRIANVLNDFYNRAPGDLDGFLTKVNNVFAHMMFVTPIPHGANVGTHWAVGRGLEWLRPRGYYSLAADGLQAVHEVWTMGPRYLDYLRSGGGLLSASVETENFYKVLTSKLLNAQLTTDPFLKRAWDALAQAVLHPGATAKDLVQAEYRWSRRTLWRISDVFMMQRMMELERNGASRAEAIAGAEKDIPNYRVPTEVLGSHALHQALTDGRFLIFGRYHYGLINALGSMVRDLIGPSATLEERMEAAGKLVVMGALAMGTPSWWRPSGPMAPIEGARKVATQGPNAWPGFVSSLLTLGPAIDMGLEVMRNLTWSGAQAVRSGGTPLGNAAHVVEEAAGHTYQGQLVSNVLKHGSGGVIKDLGTLGNLKLGPQYEPSAAAKKYEASKARSAESHDPLLNFLGLTHPKPKRGKAIK